MSGLSGLVLRRFIDALMALLLLNAFGGASSFGAAWKTFRSLPELSQIGAITVAVFLGSLLASSAGNLVAWTKSQIAKLIKH